MQSLKETRRKCNMIVQHSLKQGQQFMKHVRYFKTWRFQIEKYMCHVYATVFHAHNDINALLITLSSFLVGNEKWQSY